MLLLNCSSAPLWGHFPARERLFSGVSLLRFVEGVERSPLELSMWMVTAWAGHTDADKMATSLHFFALLFRGSFLGCFPNSWGSSNNVSRLGFVDGYDRSKVVVVAWLEVPWSSRTVARKMTA